MAKPGISLTVMLCLPSVATEDRAAFECVGFGLGSDDQFDERQRPDRIEEVHAQETVRVRTNEAASASIEIELVLVASSVGLLRSIWLSTRRFSSRSSGTDSMTRSAVSGNRETSLTGEMRARADAASSAVSLLRSTAPANAWSMEAHITSTWALDGSTMVTWLPATANT